MLNAPPPKRAISSVSSEKMRGSVSLLSPYNPRRGQASLGFPVDRKWATLVDAAASPAKPKSAARATAVTRPPNCRPSRSSASLPIAAGAAVCAAARPPPCAAGANCVTASRAPWPAGQTGSTAAAKGAASAHGPWPCCVPSGGEGAHRGGSWRRGSPMVPMLAIMEFRPRSDSCRPVHWSGSTATLATSPSVLALLKGDPDGSDAPGVSKLERIETGGGLGADHRAPRLRGTMSPSSANWPSKEESRLATGIMPDHAAPPPRPSSAGTRRGSGLLS